MTNDARIKELIEAYPEVDLTAEPLEILVELAGYSLAQRRRELYRLDESIGNPDALDTERWREQQIRRGRRKVVRDVEKIATIRAERNSAISNAVDAAIRREAMVLREFNGILLGERFALPDGSTVAWGDATIVQHEARIRMLELDAAGVIETAARHRHAVNSLRISRAVNLNAHYESEVA